MAIPATALRSDGGERSVFVVDGESVRKTRISTGLELSEWVEVVEGLLDGDRVVIAAAGMLQDGSGVRVQP
jgi:multidrug efflux pump subunit AcrA (membrane-fusion protein)